MSREKCYRPKAAFPNHKDRVDIRYKQVAICVCMDCEEQIYGPELTFDELGAVIAMVLFNRKNKSAKSGQQGRK